MPSHWETILKNTLDEIEMKKKDMPWDEWLKDNDPSAYDDYLSEVDEAVANIEDEWKSRVAMMRDADNSDAYVKALES